MEMPVTCPNKAHKQIQNLLNRAAGSLALSTAW
jgi:hypothetical protein